MIIGHLPAGYISTRCVLLCLKSQKTERNFFLLWGMLGSIMPDIDMFYFHLIDHRQHHHHSYFTHFPIVWAVLLAISLLWVRAGQNGRYAVAAVLFSLNGLIHMLLDSLVGDIWWYAPIIDKAYSFYTVPALYKPWWLNFIFHWSFILEIVILLYGYYLWQSNDKTLIRQKKQNDQNRDA